MNDILISVIVPVFNCEAEIRKCINSILNQTYKHLQIIIVDDASTDSSLQVCKSFKDDRIILISKEHNSGVSDSRNIGIEASSGSYITFVDADDYLEETAIEEICSKIELYKNPDIVVFGIISEYYSNGKLARIVRSGYRDRFITREEFVDEFFTLGLGNPVWNKVFRRNVIESARFNTSLKVAEDLEFCLDAYSNIQNLYLDGGLYYHYFIDTDKQKTYLKDSLNFSGTIKRVQRREEKYRKLGIKPNLIADNYYKLIVDSAYDYVCMVTYADTISKKEKEKYVDIAIKSDELKEALRYNGILSSHKRKLKRSLLLINNSKIIILILHLSRKAKGAVQRMKSMR